MQEERISLNFGKRGQFGREIAAIGCMLVRINDVFRKLFVYFMEHLTRTGQYTSTTDNFSTHKKRTASSMIFFIIICTVVVIQKCYVGLEKYVSARLSKRNSTI